MTHRFIALFIGTFFAGVVNAAEPFDWNLLRGQWAESADHAFGCRADNLHFNFLVSSDKKTLTFSLDREWAIAGSKVKQYNASIREAIGRLLVIRYGPELREIPDEYREWELMFIGPGTYRWRSTGWKAGVYNDVIGVKCTD